MNKYTVTAVIQSPYNEPVSIDWAKDTDELGVIESVLQLIRNNQPSDLLYPPPNTISIHVRLSEVTVPGYNPDQF